MIQRAANAYLEERNAEDINHAKKAYGVIKKHVVLNPDDDRGPSGKFRRNLVDFKGLTPKVQQMISNIKEWGVEGESPRGFHSNRGGHLPESDPGANTGDRAEAFKVEVTEEALDQKGKLAQYAEYHVTESGLGKAFRLLYNYVTEKFYISLSHYNIWDLTGQGDQNPFFEVINIP